MRFFSSASNHEAICFASCRDLCFVGVPRATACLMSPMIWLAKPRAFSGTGISGAAAVANSSFSLSAFAVFKTFSASMSPRISRASPIVACTSASSPFSVPMFSTTAISRAMMSGCASFIARLSASCDHHLLNSLAMNRHSSKLACWRGRPKEEQKDSKLLLSASIGSQMLFKLSLCTYIIQNFLTCIISGGAEPPAATSLARRSRFFQQSRSC
mmetsp:Transcript_147316/g.274468  ORF Transcript_147316/g.274468 Transcript_147316/m.274468 type:complete len:214 (-) Transcript_147316:1443-2084(-)